MYYGMEPEEGSEAANADPIDINSSHFMPDIYLNKLMKEKSLTELMDKETEMVITQKTQNIHPMLVPPVTLGQHCNQHWVNVLCLLGSIIAKIKFKLTVSQDC